MNTMFRNSCLTVTALALMAGATACTNTESAASSDGEGASQAAGPVLGAGGQEAAQAVAEDPAVSELVPQDLKEKGTMELVTDPTYAPIDFTDDKGNIVGLEPDMALAAAKKMGLDITINKGDFNGILAGIEAERYDASWAAFSITPERQERVTMVSYMQGGTSVMVKKDNPDGIREVLDLCGKTVAAQTGTTQALNVLPSFQEECKKAGKEEVTELVLPQQDNVNQAVATGRASAMAADGALIAYYSQLQPDVFAAVEDILVEPSLAGVVVNKKDKELADAFKAAVDSLIADGTYTEIMEAWSLGNTAVEEAEINPAK